MNTLKYKPEGWNNEVTVLEKGNIENLITKKETLQGLVKECDEKYNLYVNLGNGITGIIPREEVEEVNIEEDGLPKVNLCTGKIHKFVQFKVKEEKDENTLILSRKAVQKEALDWVKNDLKEGQVVLRNC